MITVVVTVVALIVIVVTIAANTVYLTKSASEGAQTQIYLSASKNIGLSDAGDYEYT